MKPQNPIKNLSTGLFTYGLLFAAFHIAPAFLIYEIRDKLMLADLFDLFTPLVMTAAVLWLIFYCKPPEDRALSPLVKGLLFLGAVLFVEGHGIHLSANAIHRHLVSNMPPALLRLTYFFDEQLGHILWDSGNILLALAILLRHFRQARALNFPDYLLLLSGGAFYGFTYFVNSVEGQTTPFTLPYIALFCLVLLHYRRRKKWRLGENGAPLFFLAAAAVALIFYLIWYLIQGGLPEFSAVGWI
ncbi:MAG: hypothetical protein Kow0042_20840 [Calditrichia bacterium]